jgi:hypothetical protein
LFFAFKKDCSHDARIKRCEVTFEKIIYYAWICAVKRNGLR